MKRQPLTADATQGEARSHSEEAVAVAQNVGADTDAHVLPELDVAGLLRRVAGHVHVSLRHAADGDGAESDGAEHADEGGLQSFPFQELHRVVHDVFRPREAADADCYGRGVDGDDAPADGGRVPVQCGGVVHDRGERAAHAQRPCTEHFRMSRLRRAGERDGGDQPRPWRIRRSG